MPFAESLNGSSGSWMLPDADAGVLRPKKHWQTTRIEDELVNY